MTSPINSLPLISEPPTEPDLDSAQSKLNLNSKIEVPSEKNTSVEPTFLSIVKEEPDDVLDCKDNIVDDQLNLNMSVQPLMNDSQSDLAVKEMSYSEKMLHLISNSKSPLLDKEIYFKLVDVADKNLNVIRENEKLEAESLLNSKIRISILNKVYNFLFFINIFFNFVLVLKNTMHESPNCNISFSDENLLGKSSERNIPDGAMSLSTLPFHDEEIIENDTILPQYTKLPNNPPYCPSQFNNNYCYQYFQFSPSHYCDPPLLSANYCKSKPLHDRCKNENLSAEIKKYK